MGQWKMFNLILQHIVFFQLLFGEHMRRALYDTKYVTVHAPLLTAKIAKETKTREEKIKKN